jgi:hypothetical protein
MRQSSVMRMTDAKEHVMPRKAKGLDQAVAKHPPILKELVARFLTGPMNGEAIEMAGAALKKVLSEATLTGELSHHLS